MTETREPVLPLFARRIAVETPEHVVLELELAGFGSRAAAALYDAFIIGVLILLLGFAVSASGLASEWAGAWLFAFWIAIGFAMVWGYFVLNEGLRGGRTPGKKRVGIRVVMDTGHPLTFGAAAVRNLLRIVDAQPGLTYGVGGLFVFFTRNHRRLGDLVAGTIVVRDRPHEVGLGPGGSDAEAAAVDLESRPPLLTDDEFHLLSQYLERQDALAPEVRARFEEQLTRRFADRFSTRERTPGTFLPELYTDEVARRRGRFGASRGPGAGRVTQTAERFVARKRAAWEAFRVVAAKAEREGLKGLTGDEVTAFAARYREVAADLARARVYGLDPRVQEYLERVVSAGHNALYGLRGVGRISFRQLLTRDIPGAVVGARAYVMTAALIFTAGGAAGFLLIRGQPERAHAVLPDQMIARAEAGLRHQAAGRGYAEAPSLYLPVVASRIVSNNIQVSFAAFAMGVTAGIGTVAIVAFNGVFFGAVMGLFANYGLLGWLLTFVAAHGPLELTSIFIAAGAGLLIGRAILAPGDLARRDALIVSGRTAVRMLGASTILLVIAGVIEGFVSAGSAPAPFKFMVSGLTVLLMIAITLSGLAARSNPGGEAGGSKAVRPR